ncbi:YciI family protein [Spirosoma aerolatum]|uniref:YciI family protein n=1 Tax=Spirosoma aerolatum TaxID=1211326 RepID=UPI0009AD8626|nr:YciI family protein [Spirosoma aerolatum]
MKTYLVLVREPDGRMVIPPAEDMQQHQLAMKSWIEGLVANGYWLSGQALMLSGRVVRPTADDPQVTDGPYRVDELEIVGGYMLLQAASLDDVTALMKTCPVLDTDGFVEIRETM